MQNSLEQLKDIKDIVQVEDHSLFILIAIIFSTIFLILIITAFLKGKKRRKKATKKELAYKRLRNLDFTNTKDVVYIFTLDGALFVDEKNNDLYNDILRKIEKYKYKKDIDSLDKTTQNMIKDFIKTIRLGKKR